MLVDQESSWKLALSRQVYSHSRCHCGDQLILRRVQRSEKGQFNFGTEFVHSSIYLYSFLDISQLTS